MAAGLLPWFYYAVADGRTMFAFYVLPALPFLILAVVYALGAIMTPPTGMVTGDGTHRPAGGRAPSWPASYVVLVAVCFAYFYPIFVGHLIPYESWQSRMWLGQSLDLSASTGARAEPAAKRAAHRCAPRSPATGEAGDRGAQEKA